MGRKKPQVTVILTAYNGEKFLDLQIKSIANQIGVRTLIYVNDDGSSDATLNLLWKYQSLGIIEGISQTKNVGVSRAVLDMLKIHGNSKYLAISDQDDLWQPDKLVTQLSRMKDDSPCLVFTSREIIDWRGENCGFSKDLRFRPGIENAVFENVAPGNTILLNNKAIRVINAFDFPEGCFYDSWLYLLISAVGNCIYVNTPLTKYRIHDSNLVGLRKLNLGNTLLNLRNYLSQIRNLIKSNSYSLNDNSLIFLKTIIDAVEERNFLRKILRIYRLEIRRQSQLDQFFYKLLLLFSK